MPSATRAYASAWLLALCVTATPCAIADDPSAGADVRHTARATVAAAVGAAVELLSPARAPARVSLLAPPAAPLSGVLLPERACAGPDGRSLGAIIPVATDAGSHASGVIVAPGRVLTAAHVIQGAQRVFVRREADYRLATVLRVDPITDLAVLAADTGAIQPLMFTGSAPDDDEPVWAVGFPRAQDLSLSTGVFQQMRDGALHTSAGIDSGQSGGGLLACRHGRYRLAGMLRGYGAYLEQGRYVKLPNHSVSVAASTIRQFLHGPY